MHALPGEDLYGVDEPEPGLAVHVDRAARYAPADLQARALGQDDRDGSVVEPGRPGHDLPAARHSAAGSAGADLPHRHRHHDDLPGRHRRRRRLRGVPHDPDRREAARSARAAQYTYMGYTVGKWEGDTLVLDSIGFTDETWLARGGYFHSDQMRVVEKFTRTGNQLALRRDRRGSGSAGRAVGHADAEAEPGARTIRSSPNVEAARKASTRKSPRRCGTEFAANCIDCDRST